MEEVDLPKIEELKLRNLASTGCTFKGRRIFLEYACQEDIRAFRKFSRKLAESRFPPEDLKPEEQE